MFVLRSASVSSCSFVASRGLLEIFGNAFAFADRRLVKCVLHRLVAELDVIGRAGEGCLFLLIRPSVSAAYVKWYAWTILINSGSSMPSAILSISLARAVTCWTYSPFWTSSLENCCFAGEIGHGLLRLGGCERQMQGGRSIGKILKPFVYVPGVFILLKELLRDLLSLGRLAVWVIGAKTTVPVRLPDIRFYILPQIVNITERGVFIQKLRISLLFCRADTGPLYAAQGNSLC